VIIMTDVAILRVGQNRIQQVPLLVTNFDIPYAKLHKAAVASGYEVRMLYEHGDFKNPFHDANVAQHDEFGYWAEILPDKVKGREKETGETSPGEGFTPVLYVAHAGRPHELQVKGWAPGNGLYVPVGNEELTRLNIEPSLKGYRFVMPGTLIPLKRVDFSNRAAAEAEFKKFNLPIDELSGFYNSNNYNEWRFVGRGFVPDGGGGGRFGVAFDGRPDGSGCDLVGCRFADEFKSVMEFTLPEEAVAQAKQ
jgi:hypothetical protein